MTMSVQAWTAGRRMCNTQQWSDVATMELSKSRDTVCEHLQDPCAPHSNFTQDLRP